TWTKTGARQAFHTRVSRGMVREEIGRLPTDSVLLSRRERAETSAGQYVGPSRAHPDQRGSGAGFDSEVRPWRARRHVGDYRARKRREAFSCADRRSLGRRAGVALAGGDSGEVRGEPSADTC